MPTLATTNFNITLSIMGNRTHAHTNSHLPRASNLVRPLEYALGSADNVAAITLGFSRLSVPAAAATWASASLLVWALVPGMTPLHALAVGSCLAPTDPVLSAVIVKGRSAESNMPEPLQRVVVVESGLSAGLAYPILFFALYLVKCLGGDGGNGGPGGGGARVAMGLWFSETWGYTLLHWAEELKWVDRESILVFAISLALFVVGTCGMIGSDDFRLETLDDSLQRTVDMLLNVSVFLWYGAMCPWERFVHNSVVPIRQLISLGVLIEEVRQAVFVGFFGPVRVSAICYLYITPRFLRTTDVDGQPRADVGKLPEQVTVVAWFIAICSIVVHGLSIPLGKLGYYLPRILSSGPSVYSVRGNAVSRRGELDAAGDKASGRGDGPEYGRNAAASAVENRKASSAEISTLYSGRTMQGH
ncbi:Na(+)/H(+) antiporter [Madurella mycetomatis]|uniref:Na(+)/H(+) antiporter n=1 Tax=Madurella mycetomatis TaxID=100816 RepID=A0A175VPI9_9PEZI|nr:Na(+)/H(+) antiporter [Madurella mycetomatis]